jgi:GrpB-like predicted nucleotidyltransferase (UPF0157 family)
MARTVEVVAHNQAWEDEYRREADYFSEIPGAELVALHHIGSTSIAGIFAKPIIDILGVVHDIEHLDLLIPAFESAGYQPMGEYGIPGRRYYRKLDGDRHLVHIHVFQEGSHDIARHLHFRDYLRTHPEDAQAYSELKQKLAEAYSDDRESYMDGKDAMIKELERKAAAWVERQSPEGF